MISEEGGLKYFHGWQDDRQCMLGESWSFVDGRIRRERVAWKLPKRGDDLYKYYLRQKLGWIERLPSECVFNPGRGSKVIQQTNFLFVTWTTQVFDRFYDNRQKNDVWKKDSVVCNRTLTRLRQHYGRISYLRSNEGTMQGFPAPHGVLFFHDKTWNIHKIKQKWRLFDQEYQELKSILEGKDKRASPVQGFTDIQGIFNPRASLKHITKYCYGRPEDYPQEKRARKLEIQDRSYFWLWTTRKHTYSMSRGNKNKDLGDFQAEIQKQMQAKADLTRTGLGISKDRVKVWVSLRVGSPGEAENWDKDYEKEVKPPWIV